MYHVLETAITVSLFYFISFILYRTGFYSQIFHRRLWNIILAITFLFTALAGIFLALQSDYKWNFPAIKAFLKWHVEVGVCLGMTGIFHFIWHLTYFSRIFTREEKVPAIQAESDMSARDLRVNLLAIGFMSTSVQFLLMRELMNVSGGSELITGIFFGTWLIASASGAAIAGRSSLTDLKKINLLLSVSPFISLFLMIFLARILIYTGETPSLPVSIIYTFLMLAPFCLVSSFAFIKILYAARRKTDLHPGGSFSIETTGGIAAGLVLSFLTAGIFNTYFLFLVITGSYIAFSILTFYIKRHVIKNLTRLLFASLLVALIFLNPDRFFRQLMLPAVKVLESRDTPYGNITKGLYAGEESTYYNQRLIVYNDDVIEREEDIHYAMLQRPSHEKVILISGSPETHIKEIAKYNVKNIVFIERDPALADRAEDLKKMYSNVTIENKDAYRYIKSPGEKADVIILLLPPPSTLSLNRYYTTEFFTSVKGRLTEGGVFMCTPGPGENYLNRESVNLYSSVFNSMAAVFTHVIPVSGNKLYFIASDQGLSVDFCKMAEEKNISNIYVSSDYLSDELTERKSAEVLLSLDRNVRQNHASYPVACLHFLSYNLSKDLGAKMPALILLILAFAVPFVTVKRRNIIMYFSSAALAGFEIIILFSVQLTAGNMYQFTGVILASVMTGLAAGAGTKYRFIKPVSIRTGAIVLILYYIFAAIAFDYFARLSSIGVITSVTIIAALIPSYFTGRIFRELTEREDSETSPASVYSADLAGSALGFILIAGAIIPVLGITVSVFSVAVLIFAGILFGTTRNK